MHATAMDALTDVCQDLLQVAHAVGRVDECRGLAKERVLARGVHQAMALALLDRGARERALDAS